MSQTSRVLNPDLVFLPVSGFVFKFLWNRILILYQFPDPQPETRLISFCKVL